MPIEIRTKESRFPIRGETIDVSLSGCYIATMLSLPIGAEIEVRLWIAATAIDCKAVIRTSDPGVGNGIEFLDLDDLAASMLAYHLDKAQSNAEAQPNQPTGVIRTSRM